MTKNCPSDHALAVSSLWRKSYLLLHEILSQTKKKFVFLVLATLVKLAKNMSTLFLLPLQKILPSGT